MEEERILRKRLILKKSIRKFINQTLLSIIILLVGMISVRQYPELKQSIQKKVYEDNLEFAKAKKLYDEYLGSYVPLSGIFQEEQAVFSETISYKTKEEYKDGVKLKVDSNYMVPAMNTGIVVFIGEKEGYGNTVIIEQTDGTDVFYGNVSNVNVNIYDYVEKGSLIGEVSNNELYLVFQKEGNVIDYKEYI